MSDTGLIERRVSPPKGLVESTPTITRGGPDGNHSISRTHLANERTFLAWVRTAISIIALGFAAAAFLDGRMHRSGLHIVMAVGMVSAGAILLQVGYLRYREASVAIDADRTVSPRVRSVALATISITVASVIGVIYLAIR